MLLLLASSPGFAWPATDDEWTAVQSRGTDVVDVVDDHDRDDLGSDDSIDCVGDAALTAGALYWSTDGEELFVRMRVDDDPWFTEGSFLLPLDWSFLIDVDGDDANFEYVLALAGASPTVYLYQNRGGDPGVDVAALDLVVVNATHYQVGEADTSLHTLGDWFIDVSVDLGDLPGSFSSRSTFRLAGVTGASGTPVGANADLCGTDDSTTLGALADAWSDSLGIDQDGDGALDLDEDALGTDATDADSDDDGVSDGEEIGTHATDPLDCDSDEDTLSDGLELGVGTEMPDTDITVGCFVADANPDSTTDPTLDDTDGGTLLDQLEDRNGNGDYDMWETDPNDPTDDVDKDEDGIADVLEGACGGDDATDSDGDGHADADEGLADTDGDGLPDFCDDDDDDDGLLTVDEDPTPDDDTDDDADGDGLPTWEDPDSDENGVLDGDEPDVDADCDGIIDAYDLDDDDGDCADRDGDGVNNGEETTCGSNPDDPDTDADGIGDAAESCEDDEDCDELPDRLDGASDPDGCADPIDTAPTDSGGACVDGLCGGHYTGGSCSTGGGATTGMGALGATLLLLQRRRRGAAVGITALAALAAAPSPAAAADPTVNAQRYQPAFDSATFFSLHDSSAHTPGFGLGLGVNYASRPLQYTYDDGSAPLVLLGSAATVDLGASWASRRLGLTLDLPVHSVDGDLMDSTFALGDLRLGVLGEIVPRHRGVVGLGVYGDVGLPTGAGAAYVGSGSPEVGAGLSVSAGKRVVVAANLGMHIASPATLGELSWGSRVEWGAGLSVPLGEIFAAVAELEGASALSTKDVVGASPVEWRVGGRAQLGPNLVASLGAGTGLGTGIGAPEFRLLGGLRWLPAAEPARRTHGPDRDGDGIADGQDLCPDQPEDQNGKDDADGCPDAGLVPTHLVVTDGDGRRLAGASVELTSGPEIGRWTLPDGELTRSLPAGDYAARVRAPRFVATEARLVVPDAPRHEQAFQLEPAAVGGTLILTVQNEAGQPIAALVTLLGEGRKFTTGGDGLGTEPVPNGEVELSVWAEGYRPERLKVQVAHAEKKSVLVTLGVSRVVVLKDRVDIRDKVFFELDSATITAESYRILDDVAATLDNHTELRLVEVQGHTDDQGADDYNIELSQRRGEAVRKYLIGQGIEPDRLVARGYGEAQPLQPGTAAEAREVNRRVVFRILAGPATDDDTKPRKGGRQGG
ncbi:MAG: hypothetical protein EXR71_18165 [Myxococcales bacterium]|nr:hypothetical protein [Myxococcales bacterium]